MSVPGALACLRLLLQSLCDFFTPSSTLLDLSDWAFFGLPVKVFGLSLVGGLCSWRGVVMVVDDVVVLFRAAIIENGGQGRRAFMHVESARFPFDGFDQ